MAMVAMVTATVVGHDLKSGAATHTSHNVHLTHFQSDSTDKVRFSICPKNEDAQLSLLELGTTTQGDFTKDLTKNEHGEYIVPAEKEIPMECKCARTFEPFSTLLEPMELQVGCAALGANAYYERHGWRKRWVKERDRYGNVQDVYRTFYDYGMTPEQAVRAVGSPIAIKWVRPNHHVSDYSGKTDSLIVAAPGGDLAIFVTALHAYSLLTEKDLQEDEIKLFMRGYMTETNKKSFYYRTDTTAIENIRVELNLDDINLGDPPKGKVVRQQIRDMASGGLYQGSTILKRMIQSPGVFRLRNAAGGIPLTVMAIKAFFDLLWDKDDAIHEKFRLVELEGDDKPAAVVKIYAPEVCATQGIQPLIVPRGRNVCGNHLGCDKEMLMIFPQAVDAMHKILADYFATQNGKIQVEPMLHRMKQSYDIIISQAGWSGIQVDEANQLPIIKLFFTDE